MNGCLDGWVNKWVRSGNMYQSLSSLRLCKSYLKSFTHKDWGYGQKRRKLESLILFPKNMNVFKVMVVLSRALKKRIKCLPVLFITGPKALIATLTKSCSFPPEIYNLVEEIECVYKWPNGRSECYRYKGNSVLWLDCELILSWPNKIWLIT